jgi:predicted phosphodiesterase
VKYIFLGDVHGNLKLCHNICKKYPNATVIQVGDLGVGFIFWGIISKLPSNFKFFPGNHDKRQEALTLPSCLGDYGEVDGKFFFVSGADSIDKDYRIEGVSWWPDEEITNKQAEHALGLWEKSKAQVLVCHDCPQRIAQHNYLIYDTTLTRNTLDQMIEVRKPKIIIYGHHHKSCLFDYEGITIKALGVEEVWELTL